MKECERKYVREIVTFFIVAVFVVTVLVLIVAHLPNSKPVAARLPHPDYEEFYMFGPGNTIGVYHDDIRKITCYVYRAYGISCVKDSQQEK